MSGYDHHFMTVRQAQKLLDDLILQALTDPDATVHQRLMHRLWRFISESLPDDEGLNQWQDMQADASADPEQCLVFARAHIADFDRRAQRYLLSEITHIEQAALAMLQRQGAIHQRRQRHG